MRLNKSSLKNADFWEKVGVKVPKFDVEKTKENTMKEPTWLHFGAGNIFRGFIAGLAQNLLEQELSNKGVIAAELFDYEIIDRIFVPYDNLAIAVTLKNDGSMDKEIIASITEALKANPATKDWSRLTEIFQNPSLQVVSFTITEKGYNLKDAAGNFYKQVAEDMNNGPSKPQSSMGKVLALLYERFRAGKYKLALLSLDNFARNGEKLFSSLREIAEGWVQKKLVEKEFLDYLSNEIAFPWSMIDKIVPGPSKIVEEHLKSLGIEGMEPILTEKNTHIAPFVNMEETQYLLIEDMFPNGRPIFEKSGKNVFVTDRETVEKAERMKVTACLNPLHTAISIYGHLLGYKTIAECMKDPLIFKLAKGVGEEGLVVTPDPGVISPRKFLEEVLNQRLSNPHIPDTPQRILIDTSQKVPIRFGETIKSYATRKDLNPRQLRCIPLAIAGWLRYLMGIDDNGNPLTLSPDPLLDDLRKYVCKVSFGHPETVGDNLKDVLSNERLFAVNLYQVGIGEKIEEMFKSLIAGTGAVKATLEKYFGG
ncbi:mannitol dehydrogenase family protein [Pseudothermotoga thermarum]|uniref:Mannitol dehydrogenase domain protein n=1 Tax=Pseudothermotoga thermarum DSM 5069 TaxID=688269 RepID=F7YUR3_9THEM|nr:mannitol dehydrogenase family protein [Pseudothermotoga thermarum]AEH50249.1 Mannitol dehydrogenase domain protein [Pseudothermotoga thermarum DSM 5069]